MARRCEITGKGTQSGNTVSHSRRRVKTKKHPNVQKKRFYLASENKYITLKICMKTLRTIDKLGIDAVYSQYKQQEA